MELQWNIPKWKHGYNPPAVYRIDFDNKFFYIGSSINIKSRLTVWKRMISNNKFQSKVMAAYLSDAESATVSILEFATTDTLKERETFYIREFFADALCLNQSPSGYTNEGLKPIPEHLKRPKKKAHKRDENGKIPLSPDYVWAYSKPIIQLDLDGKFIRTFKSIADSAKSINVEHKTMQEHLGNFRVYGLKGFIFRKAGELESFEIIKKKEKPKGMVKIDGKPIIDLNTGVFWTTGELANILGIKRKYVQRMLSEERKPNTTQYRYA